MSLRKSLLLVPLILVVAIGVATKALWPFQLELNRERFFAVQATIRSAAANPVIIFGDSIVEGAALPPKVCGYPFVNAGVRGAGVGYFLRHSAQLLGSSRPKLIVLAVGINNAAAKENREVNFNNRYEQLVASLKRIAPVAVATVTPIKEGYFVSSFGYDPQIVPALNRTILATPNTKAVVDLNAALSGANFTIDGVHLSAAGYALWTSAVLRGVEAALGCAQQHVELKHQAPAPLRDASGSSLSANA
jgi:lysophospholipase L1-like esterase